MRGLFGGASGVELNRAVRCDRIVSADLVGRPARRAARAEVQCLVFMHIRSIFLFCGAAVVASAEVLTLDDAIRIAWANDPSVASLALAPSVASAREVQAATRPNPELELRSRVPVKGDSEWSVGMGVSQRLPRRERVELARALARLGKEPSVHQLHEQRRKVAGEVRHLFYQIAVQQARREAAHRTRQAQAALQASLERLHGAGEVGGADLDLVRLEVVRADQNIALAEAELTALLQRLRRRLRYSGEAPIEAKTDFAALLGKLVSGEVLSQLSARPAIALADLAVRQAEAALALSRSESKPDWKVGAGVDFERRANDATGKLENEPTLNVSASIPWPGRIANRGDILEKEAGLRIAEANAKAIRDEVLAEIEADLETARALQPAVARYRETIAAAAALPERLRAAYERGEVSAFQLAQAGQQRFGLEMDFLAAASRYLTALANAETAAGAMPTNP